MTNEEMRRASDLFVLHALRREQTLVFEKAKGVRLWDIEGREYLDAISGTNGPAMVGHAHPAVVGAVTRQMSELPSTFLVHDSVPLIKFCEKMASIAPNGLSKTFLCPGGGEAVEAAVKLAIRITGKPGVLSLTGAYHGMSLGIMSLGGIPSLREWFPGGVRWPNFHQVASGDPYRPPIAPEESYDPRRLARSIEAGLDQEGIGPVGALVIEVVQGPGGHVVFASEYYAEVQRICRERGLLLIVDEVQTGLGRCGTMWACDLFNIEPDIIVFGKAFGGGFPFGGFTIRPELIPDGLEEEPWHVLTFMNQPLQAAAGLAVIGVVERERLVERANVLGERAAVFLSGVRERYRVVGDVRGPGLFIGIDLVEDHVSRQPASTACRKAWTYALSQGLITWFGGAGNVLKFKPPLTVSEGDFDAMLELTERTIAFVEREVHG